MIGLALLLVLAGGVLYAHRHYLHVQEACGRHLTKMVPRLEAFAKAHHGALPTDLAFFHGEPYALNPTPRHWKENPPHPYLWDPMPHAYVNGFHVLFTDGTVRLVPVPPANP